MASISHIKYFVSIIFLSWLATNPCSANTTPQIEAYSGAPLGIASIHFSIEEASGVSEADARFNLAGEHSRVLYPVFFADTVPSGSDGPIGTPGGFEVLFLFKGQDPFRLTSLTNLDSKKYREFKANIQPQQTIDETSPRARSLMRRWWKGYRTMLDDAQAKNGHYPIIESYLSWHLPRTLALDEAEKALATQPTPQLSTRPLQMIPEAEQLADLLIGTESIRIAMQRKTLLRVNKKGNAETLSIALPQPVSIPPVQLKDIPPDLEIEPVTSYVPQECLYIRFPKLSRFRSLREQLESMGGKLHDLILGRALDADVKATLQTQLALHETELGKLFGDLVIGEVALVAHDTFVREGSALGVIFEVKNRDPRQPSRSLHRCQCRHHNFHSCPYCIEYPFRPGQKHRWEWTRNHH